MAKKIEEDRQTQKKRKLFRTIKEQNDEMGDDFNKLMAPVELDEFATQNSSIDTIIPDMIIRK